MTSSGSNTTRDLSYLDEDSHAVSGAVYIFKNGPAFVNLDKQGGISPAVEATGLYSNDTQYIRTWQTTLPDSLLKLTAKTSAAEKTDINLQYKNKELVVDRSVLVCDERLQEMVSIFNATETEISVPVEFTFGTSFTDIFAIRGDKGLKTGEVSAFPHDNGIHFRHDGVDGIGRYSDFTFSLKPKEINQIDNHTYVAKFDIRVAPGNTQNIILVGGKPLENAIIPSEPLFKSAQAKARSDFWEIFQNGAWVESSNPEYNEVLITAQKDMALLVTKLESGFYPFAGLPWFATPFGRDALIVGMQMLAFKPDVLRGVLTYQGQMQATKVDARIQAQPGKIFHEVRKGESSQSGQNPFQNYYGGVDTTLLYIKAHFEYFRRTNDIEFLRQEWPHIEMAVTWMKEYGDLDDDALIKHEVPLEGLTVQSWMDSGDSMNDTMNNKPKGPLAICDVQGHAYIAYTSAAKMAEALGHAHDVDLYESYAAQTKKAFNENFWSDELGTYVRAVDGSGENKNKIMIKGSNPGQALHDIMTVDRRNAVVKSLMAEDSFSGWGIRTVAEGQPGYNSTSYHRGSIWPHDNSIIVENMMKTHPVEALRLMKALTEAAGNFPENRLPELFGGATRTERSGPELYPAACSPHAWASAGHLQMLNAATGMELDPLAGTVSFKYKNLPEWMGTITIHNLRVGDNVMTLIANPPDDEKKMMVAPAPELT